MTPLRKRMLEELQLRNLAENTVTAYVGAVQRFAQYFRKSPGNLGADQVREYLVHLINDKKDSSNTIQVYRSALKFLYVGVLKQGWFDEAIPVGKQRRKLPTVLSAQDITNILNETINLKHWMIIATFYATALRCDELRHLKVCDIRHHPNSAAGAAEDHRSFGHGCPWRNEDGNWSRTWLSLHAC